MLREIVLVGIWKIRFKGLERVRLDNLKIIVVGFK